MRTADLLSSTLWIFIGAYFIYAGKSLDLGELRDPGSGFMIFWVGIVMVALSGAVFAAALLRPVTNKFAELWTGSHNWRVVRFVVALCVYAVLLPWLGFILATVLLLIVLFRAVEPTPWWLTFTLAISATVACELVFHRWLGINLPAGFFGGG